MEKYTKSSIKKSKKEFKKKHCQNKVVTLYNMGYYFALKYDVRGKVFYVSYL